VPSSKSARLRRAGSTMSSLRPHSSGVKWEQVLSSSAAPGPAKSHHAQQLAAVSGLPVLFVATATAVDEEMRLRIEVHKKSRPDHWHTHEAPLHIGTRIRENIGKKQLVVIDCITMLLNNIFMHCGPKQMSPLLKIASTPK